MAANSAHSIPAAVGDKAMHLLNGLAGDFQIGLVAQLSRRLDETVLEYALAHVLAALPVAASRFVTKPCGASWEPVPMRGGTRVKIYPGEGEESGVLSWFENPVDCRAGPAVEWAIFRREADCLCVKQSHLVADAGGLKELAYLVAGAYAAAAAGRPLPAVPARPRGIGQIAARFSFSQKTGIFGRMVKDLSLHHPFATPANPPGRVTKEKRRVYVKVAVPPVLVRALRKWGKERNATMNDVIMAAFLRALAHVAPQGRNRDFRLVVTADLRRYLAEDQRTGSVANLSGWVLTRFSPSLGPDLAHTCRMVSRQMSDRKRDYLGLGMTTAVAGLCALPPAMVRSLAGPAIKKAARARMVAPSLTNMGRVDHHRLNFGGVPVKDAFLLAPVIYPPVLGVGVSGFKDALTLSCGFLASGFAPGTIKELLKRTVGEMERADTSLRGGMEPVMRTSNINRRRYYGGPN